MDDSSEAPAIDELLSHLENDRQENATTQLHRIQHASVEDRKAAMRALRTAVEDCPTITDTIIDDLASFLSDDERSVRLTTAKLFVTLARTTPDTVVPVVSSLAERLADEAEFYYVRARSAETLGYVALEHPEVVAEPEILADFRIGLSFDEPEVKEKLAKALEHVALGDPDRLRHQVSSLIEHLDDGNELVRYHLCTMLVAVGSEHPTKLADAQDALTKRLTDENPYVRGRAAEALGVLDKGEGLDTVPNLNEVEPGEGEAGSFVTERVQFARGDRSKNAHDEVGTVASIRSETDEIVSAITDPDGDGECPQCGLTLPKDGPPMCPRCGAPH